MRNLAPRRSARAVGDKLLLADSQRGEQRRRRQIEAKFVEQPLSLADHRGMLEKAEPDGFVAEKQIGGDRKVAAEHDLLMDRVDAQRDRLVRTGQRDRLALPEDFAARARDERR